MEEESDVSWTKCLTNFLLNIPKFLFVLACYTILAYAMVLLILWFLPPWDTATDSLDVQTWFSLNPDDSNPTTPELIAAVIKNIFVFGLFMAQHTLLARRNFSGTCIYKKLCDDWKIDKAVYTLATAITIIFFVKNWTVIPIYIWKFDSWKAEYAVTMVHSSMWVILYGTVVMQDAPDLVGIDQAVVVENPTRKSTQFLDMLGEQRHTGLLPLTVVTVFVNLMTVDRVLFLLLNSSYCYYMWKQSGRGSYDYVKEMSLRKLERIRNEI